jgi:hypothetical protein
MECRIDRFTILLASANMPILAMASPFSEWLCLLFADGGHAGHHYVTAIYPIKP